MQWAAEVFVQFEVKKGVEQDAVDLTPSCSWE
jgi:hypothetical protein